MRKNNKIHTDFFLFLIEREREKKRQQNFPALSIMHQQSDHTYKYHFLHTFFRVKENDRKGTKETFYTKYRDCSVINEYLMREKENWFL